MGAFKYKPWKISSMYEILQWFMLAQQAGLAELLYQIASDPVSLAFFVIRFLLGFAIGYVSLRILKYIVFILIALGIALFLNVWEAQGGARPWEALTEVLKNLGLEEISWETVQSMIASFQAVWLTTTVFPLVLGFIVGLIIAIIRYVS